MLEILEGFMIVIVYVLILLGLSRLSGVKYTDLIKNRLTITKGIIMPVGISTVLLVMYLVLTDQLIASFTPSVTAVPWIAWVAPIVVIAGIIARIPNFNRKKYSLKTFGLLCVATALVGFSEELLLRGVFPYFLNEAGLSAFGIVAISSIVFGLLHGVNFFNGQDGKTTSLQIILTSFMGVNFFAILAVTGHLWVAMVAHALYDLSAISISDQINKAASKSSIVSTVVAFLSYISAVSILIGYLFI